MATAMVVMVIAMAAVAATATAMATATAAVAAMATAMVAATTAQQLTKRKWLWRQWRLQMRTRDPMEVGRGVLPPHKHNIVGRYCLYLLSN
jgi:membrane protein YdbS with pleckstrin-like domain